MRRDDGKTTVILRLDEDRLYIVDHRREVFHTLALPIEIADFLPTGMETVYDSLRFAGERTASDDTRTFGEWTAHRHELHLESEMGMAMDVEVWLSPDPPVDAALYRRLAAALASVQPAGDWTTLLADADGFPVRQDLAIDTMGGVTRVSEELLSVTEGEPPPGSYEPPADYGEERYDPLDELGARKPVPAEPAHGEEAAPEEPEEPEESDGDAIEVEVVIEEKPETDAPPPRP